MTEQHAIKQFVIKGTHNDAQNDISTLKISLELRIQLQTDQRYVGYCNILGSTGAIIYSQRYWINAG